MLIEGGRPLSSTIFKLIPFFKNMIPLELSFPKL